MLLKNELYLKKIKELCMKNISWEILKNKKILITGASGLIASCLVDSLMYRNSNYKDDIKILALVRNKEEAEKRFEKYLDNNNFKLIVQDISNPINIDEDIDYIVHAASGANPTIYTMDPVGIMKANFLGTLNLLEYAKIHNVKRFIFISSGEVYGEKEGKLNEVDNANASFTNFRDCYPESKRASETLCACFKKQYNIDTISVRFCHIYGPTMTEKDTRAVAQFIKKAVNNENIVLKSTGMQIRAYCYVFDAISALLYILFYGESDNAYNVADKKSITTIKELAEIVSNVVNRSVKYEIPDEIEKQGYTNIKQTVMSTDKIELLGWKPKNDLKVGITETIEILKNN